MQKNTNSQAGYFNPRIFTAFLLCSFGAWMAMLSFASTPSSGIINPATNQNSTTYTAGPFFQANQSPVGLGQVDTGPRCDNAGFPCDTYTLHVQLPANYGQTHCFPIVRVTASWTDTGSGQSDYDFYIYKVPRSDCVDNLMNPVPDCSSVDGNEPADFQSATHLDPEVAYIGGIPMDGQTHDYTLHIVPFQPTGETLTVTAELLPGPAPGSPACGGPAFGGPDAPAPGKPRFQVFEAPSPDADVGNGEYNIGFNPHTGRIMNMNSGPVWRLTPPEVVNAANPECCEGLWENKSTVSANIGVDPILFTDQLAGRTWVSNSTAGANAVYAYSDNDGDSWTEFGIATPNGGADHETIGSGPYPAPLSTAFPPGNPANQGHAVYYCSQDIVGPASCYRSDDLGVSWGASTLAYNGQGPTVPGGACGGLHGHIHVAPDGTAWLPVNQCRNTSGPNTQGGVFSTDGGTTWTTFQVPNAFSQPQGADPSMGIDANNRIYYAYVKNEPVPNPTDPPEGHAHVAVGDRVGTNVNWINDIDIGADHSVRNAVEIEAVVGTADAGNPSSARAAVGFLGTDRPGDYEATNFPGDWYAFISTTYDGGAHWTTVNSTPNDPVQHATGVWQQGGSRLDRNLLDFNEITLDDKGRVLYGYSDGCVTSGCIAGTAANDFVANMRVARQTGGKTLLASYDGQTDLPGGQARAPKPPCLSGTRDTTTSYLTWKAPDNGGTVITRYDIYRGTSAGGEGATPIGSSITTKFDDTSADPLVTHYFYIVKAINSAGTSNASNELDLPISASLLETPCALPGLTILEDGTGDQGPDATVAHDVQKLSIGEPLAFAPDKIVFVLKMQDLSTLPPNTEWPITFDAPDGNNYTVQMTTAPSDGATNVTPLFQVFNSADLSIQGSAADPASNYTTDGTITIVVPRSLIGTPTAPAVGTQLHNFLVRITISDGLGGGLTPDNMPNSLNPGGSYTIVGNAFCLPNTAPLAALSATPTTGEPPLLVTFSPSGTDADAGDTIASYTINFGDGSAAQTVNCTATCPTIQHTYTKNGDFGVQVKVTDSRGKLSSNTALVDIGVETPITAIASRKAQGSGTYDIDLLNIQPTGRYNVECRAEGSGYNIIYTFDPAFTVTGNATSTPTVTNGATVASHSAGPGANQYQVQLTGVANAKNHLLSVSGIPVHNSNVTANGGNATLNNVTASMDLLVGDVNNNRQVESGDVTLVRQQNPSTPQTLPSWDFRRDLNVNGQIDSGDVTLVRQHNPSALP